MDVIRVVVQAEWQRLRNEQMSMRMRSSFAGGLGGTRGYGDVAMLSRANTQVRFSAPTLRPFMGLPE